MISEVLLDKVMLKNWYIRGSLYAMMSILMWMAGTTWCIIAALTLDVMGCSYIVAEFQGLRETAADTAAYSAA